MNNRNGFTLIELLAVIAIIAILTLMAVPAVLKIYNKNVIKTMHIQEKEISNAANMFVEDYCEDSIDGTNECPQSYSKEVNNKKTVCLQDLQKKSSKYIDKVKYKGSDCKGYVTYYLDSETGIYGNEKAYLFCGLNDDGTYEYMTDSEYDLKEYCKCNADDEKCKDAADDNDDNTGDNVNVYCKFDGELKQGAEFVKGKYTYRYMQEGKSSQSGLLWGDIIYDGWGVQLTDKSSTEPISGSICTYINNKPVVSMAYMFYRSNASSFDFSDFDTNNIIKMNDMFGKTKAAVIDLSSFKTNKVTDMSWMFTDSQAKQLNISNLDTSNVTNMNAMFATSKATSLDLSKFDTRKVTDMSLMFYACSATELDTSSFRTDNVTNMAQMFSATLPTTLNLSNFNTSNVTNMKHMFSGSRVLNLDLSDFDTSKVTNMLWMFAGSDVVTIDLSSFDTSKVTDMTRMFYNCSNLKTIYVGNKFTNNNVTNSTEMFDGTSSVVGGAGTKYSSSHIDKEYARIDGGISSPGYFTLKK